VTRWAARYDGRRGPDTSDAGEDRGWAAGRPSADAAPRAGWGGPRVVWALALLAFLLRVAPLALPIELVGPDSPSYTEPAEGLAAGRGYVEADGSPSLVRPPGYPAFLAAVYVACGGPSPLAARLAQALLGALCVPLLWDVLRRLRAGDGVALGGAALVAVDPIAIGQAPWLLREQLLLFGVALAWWTLVRFRGRARYLLGGLALAGLTLTHQLYVLAGPFLAASDVLAAPRGRRLRRLVPWVGAGVVVALALFGWARRNERITGELSFTVAPNPVPARELWLTATCPNRWISGDPATGFQALAWREEHRLMQELGLEGTKRELYRRAWVEWRDHPFRTLGRLLRQNLWYWLEVPGAVRLVEHPRLFVLRWVLVPFHWVRLTAAAAGLLVLLRTGRWRAYRHALGLLLFFLLAPALLYPIPRYLAPACPLLDALAAVGVGASLTRRRAAVAAAEPAR